MTPLLILVLTNLSLTLTLFSMRSLKKRVIDILEDMGLLENDVLALKEIQIKQEEDLSPIVTPNAFPFFDANLI